MDKDKKDRKCSFCGKPYDEVTVLLAAPKGVYICNECVSKFYKKQHPIPDLSSNKN